VRDRGVAVILITHDPVQAAELADRRVVLERGRVIEA
jgi:ABC-type glutathione transport system ATPase component